MRTMFTTIIIVTASVGYASAQTSQPSDRAKSDIKQSTGRTDLKAYQENNQMTPQGPSGPLNTTSGGAPAESPQGQTPPGMQAAPEGSSKTIID
jgi:hypothetical protein